MKKSKRLTQATVPKFGTYYALAGNYCTYCILPMNEF